MNPLPLPEIPSESPLQRNVEVCLPDTPGKAQAQLSIQRSDKDVFVKGDIKGNFELSCDRCLVQYAYELNDALDVHFVPTPQSLEEAESSITLDDLSVDYYDHDQIDVERLVMDHVLLSLPFKSLCQDNCEGVCMECGVDLNHATCNCSNNTSDSPFAVLLNS